MGTENFETAMEKAEEFLRRETPFKRQGKFSYSLVAGSAFEKVRQARADGFSFAQICAVLESAGLLPQGANPHSFRQAFRREEVRRGSGKKTSAVLAKHAEPKHIAPPPVRLNEKKPEAPSISTAPESEEAMRERIKRMTSREINTGTGKIIKHHDGTFEY